MSDTIKGSIIGALITGFISFLIFIIGNFSTQDTIEKNTVETLSGYFDSIDKDMSYEQALQTVYKENENFQIKISNLEKELEELNQQIDSKQANLDQLNSSEKVNEVIQKATEYWNNSEFVQALTILRNSKYSDVKILYEQYSKEYSNKMLLQAESLVAERKRDEAISILNEGGLLVANDKEINDKIDEINNKPFALLSNLIPVSGTDNEDQFGKWDISSQDNYGNKYSSGICLKQSYENKVHLVYALDKKYSVLTGYFVLSEGDKNTDGNYVLYAYTLLNGEPNLLWESSVLSTATRPIPVEINVSDVMDLVIEVYDPNKTGNNAWTAIVDAKLE